MGFSIKPIFRGVDLWNSLGLRYLLEPAATIHELNLLFDQSGRQQTKSIHQLILRLHIEYLGSSERTKASSNNYPVLYRYSLLISTDITLNWLSRRDNH
jgi:hypothetical protein